MNEWVFFALFALLLAVTEFVSRRATNVVAASLPSEERTLSPRRQLAARLAQSTPARRRDARFSPPVRHTLEYVLAFVEREKR
jgi:hypothetical protein